MEDACMPTVRSNRLSAIFLLFTALFNAADYFLTMEALRLGLGEWNPFVRSLIGTGLLPVIKMLIIPVILFLIWRVRARLGRRLIFYAGIPFFVYFLLMLYFGYLFSIT
jgi:hypothetical protein